MSNFRFFLVVTCMSIGLFCCHSVDAQEITVADDTIQEFYFPVSAYHWTTTQHSQSIYPASMLTALQDKYITAMTRFYGQNQSNFLSINQVGSDILPYRANSLPKLTFTCQSETCSYPEMLAVSGITPGSAILSWRPGTLGVADNYVVAYRNASDSTYTETVVSDTSLVVSGLSPFTSYYWKVRAMCTDSVFSEWSLERSFTTLRIKAVVPYYCDFEDTVENALWNTPVNVNVWNDKWHIGSYVSYSGSHSIYVTHDNGVTNLNNGFNLYDPVYAYRDFDLDPLYPQYNITFKHRGYEHYTAFIGPPDDSPFNTWADLVLVPAGAIRLSANQSLPQDSIWMDHCYSFSVDTPGTYRLYLRYYTVNNNGTSGASIDDISITGVNCLPPHLLTALNITDSSAVLSWQHHCVDSPMGYVVGYKRAEDNNYTIINVNDTNALTVTGLSPYTNYFWRVKALYGYSDSTDWSTVDTFQTGLRWVHPLPYTCDFESLAENMAWTLSDVTGYNQSRWFIGHNTYNSANTSLYITTSANGTNNSYNNLSEAQVWAYRDIYFDPQYSGYEFTFDAKVYGRPYYACAQLFVGAPVLPTDSVIADSLVQIESVIGPSGGYNTSVWKHFHYTLDSSFAGHKRIFFLWQTHPLGTVYAPPIAIDNIAISGTNCSSPLQPLAVAADTTAQLSWRNCTIGTPESYTVAYKAISDTAYTLLNTSDTSITITGLLPLTDYSWTVRSNCFGESHSEWIEEQYFRTFEMIGTMPYTCDFEDSLENTLWGSYATASQHKWCIGTAVQHSGQYASYISLDNGVTYNTGNPYYAKAYFYRDFQFDPSYSEYVMEFDFKTFDTSIQTDISVYLMSPESPAFVIPSAGNLVKEIRFTDTLWHHLSVVANRTYNGVQRLVFEWLKQGYNVPKKSCVVDNITFTGVVFGRPFALTASNINHNSALLTWASGNRHTSSSYQLAYRQTHDTAYTVITLTDTVWQANGLASASCYHWKVRAVASNGELSAWSDEATFYTFACTPYYTDFEDEADWGGWYVSSSSSYSDTWLIGNAVGCFSAHSLFVTNDNGVTNASTSQYIHDTIGVYRDIYFVPGAAEYQITFDYLGMCSEVQLQSMDNPTPYPVFVALIPSSDQWQHHLFSIDSSFAGYCRLFFKRAYGALANKAGAVDNLSVKASSSCSPPTMLATTLTAPNAARITWNGVGASVYQVAYRIQTSNSFIELSVQDTTLLIANLQPDVPYFWKVRALCDGSYGEWSSECPFNTMPLLPYFCDYEDTVEIAHWTYDVSSDWNYWAIGEALADNGNNSLHVASSFGAGNYNYYASANLWAYRDICLIGNGHKYQISFDYKGLGQNDVDFARVYLGPPATPIANATPSGAEQIGGDLCMVPLWTHFSFDVDSAHRGLQRLYFLWSCDGSLGLNPGAMFDNIVAQVSDCAIPKNLAKSLITATTATLSWEPGNAYAQPMNYTVSYRILNDSVFNEITTTNTTLQITGLQPDSRYCWMVRANCSGSDHSLWSNSAFFATPQATPAILPYTCGFEQAEENASWSHVHWRGENEWVVGTAAHHSGESALYVSSDNGITNAYTNTDISVDWAYRDIYFAPSNDGYEVSFDFKGNGSNYHYAKVFLGEPEPMFEHFTPEGAELLGGSLHNIAEWQHYSFLLDSTHFGVQRLYILWLNNAYDATQPPAAIDNITIRGNNDTVSVTNYHLDRSFHIYPNPSTHYVEVLAENETDMSHIEVYDIYGKMLFQTDARVNPMRVNVSHLAPGMYLMRVVTDHGAVTKRFIRR